LIGMDDALVLWRALHFVATVLVAGTVVFEAWIAGPAQEGMEGRGREAFELSIRTLLWVGLGLAFLSGAGWLLAVSAAIDDAPWRSAIADGTAATVLTGTQFGKVWLVRAIVGLGIALLVGFGKTPGAWRRFAALLLAAVFAGGLALAGHAASHAAGQGGLHLLSDTLHLLAVGAWAGGLLPFVIYLTTAEARASVEEVAGVGDVTRRFSNVAVAAVLVIIVTGFVNTLELVGSTELLFGSDYGRLLIVKVLLFAVILGIAAVSRLHYVPRLSKRGAMAGIRRNSLIETALAVLILCIVAMLGIMPPAMLDHAGMHH
jgi:copper resistance protein D